MNFDLSDEQYMLMSSIDKSLSRLFSFDSIITKYEDLKLDCDAWDIQVALGLPSIMVPTKHGGAGLDLLTLAVCTELSGYYAVSTPMAYHAIGAAILYNYSYEVLINNWLDKILYGELKVGLACHWINDGEPSQFLTLDNKKINGFVDLVPYAPELDLLFLWLRDGSCGVVELAASEVEYHAIDCVDKSRPLYKVDFKNAKFEGLDVTNSESISDAVNILFAADSFGAAKRCVEISVDYAKSRKQFGKPIGQFQAVKHQLAKCALDLEPSKFLYWYAAHTWDIGQEGCSRDASLAKAYITEISLDIARMCIEIHGGMGFSWEYPLHIWLKRCMANRAFSGVPSFHYGRVAEHERWIV